MTNNNIVFMNKLENTSVILVMSHNTNKTTVDITKTAHGSKPHPVNVMLTTWYFVCTVYLNVIRHG